ncbi:MAG: ribosome recycling factor [Candidatus Izimaplasma sp.]|nr:ribosome recycling factor [Candidatus Izimaplasma bacterium]
MPDMVMLETEETMDERIETLKHDFSKVRTGRANPRMFDDVKVSYYGVLTPLNQVGNISVPEPTQLIVKPYDRSILKDIEKAILAANLGVNPSNEGTQLRINLPALTKEIRVELTKYVKKMGEEAKISIRSVRRDGNEAIKKLEKNGDISEDDSKGYQEDIQELTDKYVNSIDDLIKEKDTDIMSI